MTSEPRDASTVVLLRGSEVFLVKRHGKSAFMGGAYVFPGGKLDAADRAVVELIDPEVADRCHQTLEPTPGRTLDLADAVGLYAAAARELFEEAGVLLAEGGTVQDGEVWRRRLQAGEVSFVDFLRAHDLTPQLESLTYWAHWITPSLEPKRFDTRFFLAQMPEGQRAAHDRKETVDEAWMTPDAALTAHEAQEIYLPPPTERTLQEIRKSTEPRPIAAILPKVRLRESGVQILLPWDPDYAATDGAALDVPDPHPQEAPPSRIEVMK